VKHCPVKFVIPVEVLDLKVIDTSAIDKIRALVSRYFSVAVKRVNAEEHNVPHLYSLVPPE
jgi:hypothetical protein